MSESPSLSNTVIDNLITRKEIRADALRKLRARDRIEFGSMRTDLTNFAIDANAEAPLAREVIKQELGPEDFPNHMAVVPDGNRRWARSRDLTVGEGYAMGAKKLEKARQWAMIDNNIEYVTSFTLSTENIERRPENELEQLFEVFTKFFNRVADTPEVHEHRIKHEVRGNQQAMAKMSDGVLDAIENMETATEDYEQGQVVFLIPYGGRDELINAARQSNSLVGGKEDVVVSERGEDESDFRKNLMLGDLPDVDLMMRTSEVRLSNFMLYHNAYSEFVFMKKNWPSFTQADFYETIYKYASRDRRFGV